MIDANGSRYRIGLVIDPDCDFDDIDDELERIDKATAILYRAKLDLQQRVGEARLSVQAVD